MISNFIYFIKNKQGSLSIEFAAVFFMFVVLLYVIYDTYASISLQSKLERTTYSAASVFRERSAFYDLSDDTIKGNLKSDRSSLCLNNSNSCFKSYELITQDQVDELRKLASNLLGKEVAVKVDALFLLQDPNKVAVITDAKKVVSSFTSCPSGGCSVGISNYLATLADMTQKMPVDYTLFMPFVKRDTTYSETFAYPLISGRWVSLYRVNMCVTNAESLYLRFLNSDRETNSILPNLCSDVVVLSRCNDISDPTKGCPIYIK